MKKHWPVIAFTALLALAVGWLIFTDIIANLSRGADLQTIAEGKAIYGPREFWLNRYQTSIQTVVSSLIGLAGIVLILRQLRAMQDQSEAARIQTAAAAAGALEARLGQIRAWREGARALGIYGKDVADILGRPSEVGELRTGIRLIAEAVIDARHNLADMKDIDIDEALAEHSGETDFRSLAVDLTSRVSALGSAFALPHFHTATRAARAAGFESTRALATELATRASIIEEVLYAAEERVRERLKQQHAILRGS